MIASPPQTLDAYLAQCTSCEISEEIARLTGEPLERIDEMLHRYAAEARYGYAVVAPQLPPHGRILEIGSGLGMLSGYLKLQGHTITPLEPFGV